MNPSETTPAPTETAKLVAETKPNYKERETLPYHFTKEELLELGSTAARLGKEKRKLEGDKANVAKQFAAKIAEIDVRLASFNDMVDNGYEYRETEVAVFYDTPRAGMARVVRLDTGEVVRERFMNFTEMQYQLPLNAAEETKEAEPVQDEKPPQEEQPVEAEPISAGSLAEVSEAVATPEMVQELVQQEPPEEPQATVESSQPATTEPEAAKDTETTWETTPIAPGSITADQISAGEISQLEAPMPPAKKRSHKRK